MKTILITGVDRGIGKALTEKFLSEDFFVIGTYLSKPPFEKENFVSYQLDLSSPESIKNCVEQIKESRQKIDILINNAGILLDEEETELKTDKLRGTLEVNLIGTADFTEQIIPNINQDSHIICISSIAGSLSHVDTGKGRAPHFYPAYRISKAALNMYGNTLAERLRDQKITVSLVHPGWVKTNMGGEEADISPEKAAKNIFNFAISNPETGNFWFDGEKLGW